ncbi:glycosyltransferase family 1 protein [Kaistella sp. PBT33-4]|uniref:glycosyltransferase family 4 protein n=1 Tax=Kaistella sp. PBT33-4 TaxID=3032000 RepID=UPI0023D83B74|nr:glycosyltransferase family 1 protein [Kaistella sp. PBT33-4]MDF0718451.1 glycosyltransferase family 1 protein [Kaistella sp. PBT33-4]
MSNKILIDLERLRYPHSGIANVFGNLAKGLLQCYPQELFTLYGTGSLKKRIYPAVPIIEWNKTQKFYEGFSSKFDLIHVSHQLSSYFQRNYKKTIKIITLHDLNFLHENLTDSKRKKMLTKVQNNLRNADYIVCISNYAKEDFINNRHLFRLNKLKEITVIHNGIQLPGKEEYRLGKYAFLKNKKYILNIGVLCSKKNQMSLVEMLPFIDEDLVLIASDGKQPYKDEISKRINELQLENRVHFLSNLSEEEKYAVIEHCEAMCHPSLAEGFGIPPIEAMAFGKPVFLSKLTSLPEIGGNFAFYFEDFNPESMGRLFHEKMNLFHQNRSEMTQQIKKWTVQFSYITMSTNYFNFYKKVLTDNQR